MQLISPWLDIYHANRVLIKTDRNLTLGELVIERYNDLVFSYLVNKQEISLLPDKDVYEAAFVSMKLQAEIEIKKEVSKSEVTHRSIAALNEAVFLEATKKNANKKYLLLYMLVSTETLDLDDIEGMLNAFHGAHHDKENTCIVIESFILEYNKNLSKRRLENLKSLVKRSCCTFWERELQEHTQLSIVPSSSRIQKLIDWITLKFFY